jgi:hypothetical protein
MTANIYAPGNLITTGISSIPGMMTCTTAVSHYYVSDAGNDSNDGLTVGTPKLTLSAVFALVPDKIKHNTCVHLSGTFSDWGNVQLARLVDLGVLLIIDGGTATTDVVADTVSDINSTTTIGKGAAGWGVDAYKGYTVEITSGGQIGVKRTIQGNTATTLTVCKNWTDPGALAHFKITRPTATLTATATPSSLTMVNVGATGYAYGTTGAGTLVIQNLYFAGTNSALNIQNSSGKVVVCGVILNSTASAPVFLYNSNFVVLAESYVYNTSTFALDTLNGTNVSLLGAAGTSSYIWVLNCVNVFIQGGFFKYIWCQNTNSLGIQNGVRTHRLNCYNTAIQFANSSSYALITIGGSTDSGFLLERSYTIVGDYVTFPSNAAHGMYLFESTARITGTSVKLAGTGNTSAGVYCDFGSRVLVSSGATPTVAGATEASSPAGNVTWVNVNGGTILAELNSATLIRKGG